MRAPLIPILLLVLSTSFGGFAFAIDTVHDISIQLSIVALKAQDNVGVSFEHTMVINGLSVPVSVAPDANGVLVITPVVGDDGMIAAKDKDGNAVALDPKKVPAKFSVTTSINADGAIKVRSMTIVATNDKTATYSAAEDATGFILTEGDSDALAGIISLDGLDGLDTLETETGGDTLEEASGVLTLGDILSTQDIVMQESTNLTVPSDSKP